MKKLKRVSIIVSLLTLVFILGGCGKKQEEKPMNNFILKYNATKTVDKIIYKIGDFEGEITPMNEDKKIKEGYVTNIILPEESDISFSLKIIDEDKTLYKSEDTKIDLRSGKRAEISIVKGNNESEFDIQVINN